MCEFLRKFIGRCFAFLSPWKDHLNLVRKRHSTESVELTAHEIPAAVVGRSSWKDRRNSCF